jgi:hypothetical protein
MDVASALVPVSASRPPPSMHADESSPLIIQGATRSVLDIETTYSLRR